MPRLSDLLDIPGDIATSFNRSVVEPVGNMLSDLSMPEFVRNQWAQGEPWRIASGALMMGDPATAKQVIEQRFANTTHEEHYKGLTIQTCNDMTRRELVFVHSWNALTLITRMRCLHFHYKGTHHV